MNNELTMQNNTQQDVKRVSKSETIRFVHDVKELEMKALTLENMAKECYDEAGRIEKQQEHKISSARHLYQSECSKCSDISDRMNNLSSTMRFDWGNFGALLFGGLFGSSFIMGILLGIVLLIWYLIAGSLPSEETILYIGGILIVLVVVSIFFAAISTSMPDLDGAIKQLSKELDEANERLKVRKDELAEEEAKRTTVGQQADVLRAQGRRYEENVSYIRENLQILFEVNILPPRYRRFDCITIIDDLFVNDQVDTMREATLLCDERVHWGIVEDSLQELVKTEHCISEAVQSIARDVSMMSQDVFRIAENSAATLSEAKSTRYAAEATARAAERVEYYQRMDYYQKNQ